MRLFKIKISKDQSFCLSKILRLKIGHDCEVEATVKSNGDIIYLGKNKSKSDNGHGYKTVLLTKTKDGVKFEKRFYVHRLVATAFKPNPHNLPEVNHRNKRRGDNWASNLEWVTSSQNKIHKYSDHVPMCLVDYWRVLNLHYSERVCMTGISRQTGVKTDMVRDILNGKYNSKPQYSCLGDAGKGVGIVYGRNRSEATGLLYKGWDHINKSNQAKDV